MDTQAPTPYDTPQIVNSSWKLSLLFDLQTMDLMHICTVPDSNGRFPLTGRQDAWCRRVCEVPQKHACHGHGTSQCEKTVTAPQPRRDSLVRSFTPARTYPSIPRHTPHPGRPAHLDLRHGADCIQCRDLVRRTRWTTERARTLLRTCSIVGESGKKSWDVGEVCTRHCLEPVANRGGGPVQECVRDDTYGVERVEFHGSGWTGFLGLAPP